ncbi:MAG TPA: chemotaxis protein CheA [Verrucomicrobiae bacterium]|jgi:two-component system chemotaxis sensor kinase CheA|nr:chemotaxis protein CheA [Verrucomicrobiae bacterium]
MSENANLLRDLFASFTRELDLARPGSDQGQFPMLDLLGNLRDEAASNPGSEGLSACAKEAADKLVGIIESGKLFAAEDLTWLRAVESTLGGHLGGTPAAAVIVPLPEPAAPSPVVIESPSIMLNLAEDGELLREFITESREHLNNIEQGVLALEERPDDADTLHSIFRAFHTFKGGAGFLNLIPVNRLAHALESLLDLARQHKLVIDRRIVELILRGRDTLKTAVDQIEARVSGAHPPDAFDVPYVGLTAEVRAIVDGGPSAPAPALAPLAESAPEPAEKPAALATATVKVETSKLDALVDLVGELVISQSLVAQDLSSLSQLDPQFARNLSQIGRVTRELQRVSMSLRMVPIRGAFQKMARVVRDVGAKQGKDVRLVTEGDDTELDRNMVEELADPLMHMIRNAVDHGIENPAARVARGKPATGCVHLRARHQSGSIVVEIEDDGEGLSQERILAKAVERGLAAPGVKMTEEEIFEFIFAAGFSTAQKVTDVSGRGVGMDVVRRNIERLRGQVDVSSAPGKGSLFKLIVPLTLAIIDGLIVKLGAERFIIPTLSVRESFRPQKGMVSTVQGRGEIVNVRGRLIPLLRLSQLFSVEGAAADPTEGVIVVVTTGSAVKCLLVDSLAHRQEVVIKSVGDLVRRTNPAVAGAAILGDGRVGLILDVHALGSAAFSYAQAA